VESETVWRALASPHRRRILDLLRDGPRTTGQLSKTLSELSRFAVMQHLGVLEEAGLVLFRKEGRVRLNYANPIPLRDMYDRWVNQYASSAAETAQHLRRYAENSKEVVPNMDHNEYRLVKIEMEMRINAPQAKVFAALTSEYNNWWPHRYKPDSTCYAEGRVGGYIGENFANGGGAITGMIVYFDPPYKIISRSPSSLSNGNTGYSSETLAPDGDGCIYKREMSIWGSVGDEVEKMLREGSRALMEDALKGYLEEGKCYVAAVPK